jgi:hypothetical protein
MKRRRAIADGDRLSCPGDSGDRFLELVDLGTSCEPLRSQHLDHRTDVLVADPLLAVRDRFRGHGTLLVQIVPG